MTILTLAPWLYPLALWSHLTLVGLSLTLFTTRGLGVAMQQAWPMRRGCRLASMAIDTLLLCAGASLWALMQHNPLHEPWLALKLALLPVYVVLGSCALKRGRTRASRLLFLAGALLCASVMVAVAHTRNPLGWLAL